MAIIPTIARTGQNRKLIRQHRPTPTLATLITYALLLAICITVIYPFVNSLAYSFSDGLDARKGTIHILPRVFSTKSYEAIFNNKLMVNAYGITISRTILGTLGTLVVVGMMAYALSRPRMRGRKYYLLFCIVAMIFDGGLIPTYLLMKDLHLTNKFLVYILPKMVNVFYLILMKTYFQQIPVELEDAAIIDGCTTFQTFHRVMLPISRPIFGTIAIFEGVEQWNRWFDAFLYITEERLLPVQTHLFKVISLSQVQMLQNSLKNGDADGLSTSIMTLQSASIMITTLPILIIYFIFQKYLQKGVMVGAIKG